LQKRSTLVIGAFVALATWLPAGASAAHAPALDFTPSTLNVSCSDLVAGQSVTISNETLEMQQLRFLLVPRQPSFESRCGRIEIQAGSSELRAGDSTKITLTASSASGPAKPLTGSLVAFPSSGPLARLSIDLTAPAKATATPLVSSISGTHYDLGGEVKIWIPITKTGALPSFKEGDVIGAVTGSVGSGALTYTGHKTVGGARAIGVTESGLSAGSYSGAVHLTPGVSTGDVSISMTVKDSFWLPLIVLLAGLGLALLMTHVTGVVLPRRKLLGEAGAIAEDYKTARKQLQPTPPPDGKLARAATWRDSTLTDVADVITQLKASITEGTYGAWAAIDSATATSLQKEVKDCDSTVTSLGTMARVCDPLDAALKLVENPADLPPLPANPPGGSWPAKPKLVDQAEALLGRHDVKMAELAGLLSTITAATPSTKNIGVIENAMSSLYRDILELERRHPDPTKQPKLADARSQLVGARTLLWRTEDLDDLDNVRETLHKVRDALTPLWDEPEPSETLDAFATLRAVTAESVVVGSPFEETLSAFGSSFPEEPLQRDIREAREITESAKMLQIMAVAVALVLAVVTGMTALYIGKPFGTLWDYVTIFTWGLATPTVVAGIGSALDSFGAFGALQRRLR
jgi:hypothetical protein